MNGGTVDNSGIDVESMYTSQHLLLSPAASHWVRPRGTDLRYRHPPTSRGSGGNHNNELRFSSTDDSSFYTRSNVNTLKKSKKSKKMNQNDGNENRKQKGRRQLGGGATVAEDFNEEAAAKRFQRLIESDGGRQIRIESDDVGSNGRLSSELSKSGIRRMSLGDVSEMSSLESKSPTKKISIYTTTTQQGGQKNQAVDSKKNLLRAQLSSVSVGGIFSTSPTNSMVSI